MVYFFSLFINFEIILKTGILKTVPSTYIPQVDKISTCYQNQHGDYLKVESNKRASFKLNYFEIVIKAEKVGESHEVKNIQYFEKSCDISGELILTYIRGVEIIYTISIHYSTDRFVFDELRISVKNLAFTSNIYSICGFNGYLCIKVTFISPNTNFQGVINYFSKYTIKRTLSVTWPIRELSCLWFMGLELNFYSKINWFGQHESIYEDIILEFNLVDYRTKKSVGEYEIYLTRQNPCPKLKSNHRKIIVDHPQSASNQKGSRYILKIFLAKKDGNQIGYSEYRYDGNKWKFIRVGSKFQLPDILPTWRHSINFEEDYDPKNHLYINLGDTAKYSCELDGRYAVIREKQADRFLIKRSSRIVVTTPKIITVNTWESLDDNDYETCIRNQIDI